MDEGADAAVGPRGLGGRGGRRASDSRLRGPDPEPAAGRHRPRRQPHRGGVRPDRRGPRRRARDDWGVRQRHDPRHPGRFAAPGNGPARQGGRGRRGDVRRRTARRHGGGPDRRRVPVRCGLRRRRPDAGADRGGAERRGGRADRPRPGHRPAVLGGRGDRGDRCPVGTCSGGPAVRRLAAVVVGASPLSVLQKLAQSSDVSPEVAGSLGGWASLVLLCGAAILAVAVASRVLRARDA